MSKILYLDDRQPEDIEDAEERESVCQRRYGMSYAEFMAREERWKAEGYKTPPSEQE